MRRVAAGADLADIDAWWRRVLDELVALVAAGWEAVRRLASGYLTEHAVVEGVTVEPILAEWVADRVATSLRVTGPVEFKRQVAQTGEPAKARAVMANTLTGSSSRLVLAGERDTVMRTVEESDAILGWRRVTDDDPCAFCALLASRGAVYLTEGTASFEAHDTDNCTPEPLYEREGEPESVLQLQEQWRQATAGTSGKASIRAWRRYWDAA